MSRVVDHRGSNDELSNEAALHHSLQQEACSRQTPEGRQSKSENFGCVVLGRSITTSGFFNQAPKYLGDKFIRNHVLVLSFQYEAGLPLALSVTVRMYLTD